MLRAKSTIADPSPRRGLWFEPALAAWYDQERDGRAVWILLALFVVVWATFDIVAYSAVGIHDDLSEVFDWSRHPSAGYFKHPPLTGWIAAAWFAVFPAADWSFYLLAAVNAAVALFAVDRIARRYVEGDKRLFVLLLLMLTPFYQFDAQRFNPNAILLSTWPIATYCFLRAFASRGIVWPALAGIAAALTMLGKYYSAYLIAGFIVAALCDPRRWDYLRSPAPWISIAAGMAVLAPHLYWLATTGAGPLNYALEVHGSRQPTEELAAALAYAAGALGYILIPIAVYLAATRPSPRLIAAALWPEDRDRRMLVILLAVPLLLPIPTALIVGFKPAALWSMSGWFLLPIVLLAPAQIVLTREAAMRVALGVAAVTAAILAAAPVIAWRNYVRESKDGRAYHRLAAEELTEAWRRATGRPLAIASGDFSVAQAASFYSPDHPDSTPLYVTRNTPWVTAERLQREGWASFCFAGDEYCLTRTERNAAGSSGVTRTEKDITTSFFGAAPATAHAVITVVPPQPGPEDGAADATNGAPQ